MGLSCAAGGDPHVGPSLLSTAIQHAALWAAAVEAGAACPGAHGCLGKFLPCRPRKLLLWVRQALNVNNSAKLPSGGPANSHPACENVSPTPSLMLDNFKLSFSGQSDKEKWHQLKKNGTDLMRPDRRDNRSEDEQGHTVAAAGSPSQSEGGPPRHPLQGWTGPLGRRQDSMGGGAWSLETASEPGMFPLFTRRIHLIISLGIKS